MPDPSLFEPTDAEFALTLPPWAVEAMNSLPDVLPSPEDRMRAVISFARQNVRRDTGGPFAAGVFERASGRPVVIGVNRVVPHLCSSAHAEVMALSLAQKRLGSYDLGARGMPAYELVVNWRPCAMCYGAVLWSGVRSLVVAGDGPGMEEITGFDEGPVHPRWREEAQERGIAVTVGVLEDEALAAFREFAAGDNPVYNGRQG